MNWEAISAVSGMIATLAVVGSVVYLAIQIRQMNIMSHAQSREAGVLSVQQELFKIVDYPEIFEAFCKDELTLTEKIRLNEWLLAALKQREYMWAQFRNGILDRETFESYAEVIRIILGTKRTAQWWEFNKGGQFDPEFVRYIDDHLSGQDLTKFFDRVYEWQ